MKTVEKTKYKKETRILLGMDKHKAYEWSNTERAGALLNFPCYLILSLIVFWFVN